MSRPNGRMRHASLALAIVLGVACDCGPRSTGGADATVERDAPTTTSCRNAADCPDPMRQTCVLGRCRGAAGAPCTSDEDCFRGHRCAQSRCALDATDDGGGGEGGEAGVACASMLECDDGDPCTIDQCIRRSCVYSLSDADGDGFASRAMAPECPDCADDEPDARPGQTRWFDRPYEFLGMGSSYDWNCDGIVERRYLARLDRCEDHTRERCTDREGWADPVPACGATGRWGRCAWSDDAGCRLEVLEAARVQTCR
ncbi:MAG: hypothetical protein NZ898_13635 [Myxococcota bacterium]|nr:hypothetical protein [Myxococcota bacterium]MDW8361065.1 hypothetical protein [Myxococcales bacterium]